MSKLFETAAALRIMGDDLNPDEITSLLECEPDRFGKKGDKTPLKNGRERIERTGIWGKNTPRTQPGNLDSQIAALLDSLTADLSIWSNLSSRFEVQIICGLFLKKGNEGLYISAETTRLLGARGIAMDLDIYGGSDV